jgi:FtsH-binding integral membrane protein
MNENGNKQNLQDVIDQSRNQHKHKFHLKRIHHKWWFWVGMILIFSAIMYYILSVDFAFAPRKQLKQQTETNTTP